MSRDIFGSILLAVFVWIVAWEQVIYPWLFG